MYKVVDIGRKNNYVIRFEMIVNICVYRNLLNNLQCSMYACKRKTTGLAGGYYTEIFIKYYVLAMPSTLRTTPVI